MNQPSSSGSFKKPPGKEPNSSASKVTEKAPDTEYANGLLPLLWLGIPFALALLYGLLT